MFGENVSKTRKQMTNLLNRKADDMKEERVKRVQRFADMQSVVSNKLAMSQQSVNNAENYPSTWTTNPDGGANGQV